MSLFPGPVVKREINKTRRGKKNCLYLRLDGQGKEKKEGGTGSQGRPMALMEKDGRAGGSYKEVGLLSTHGKKGKKGMPEGGKKCQPCA